MKIMYPYSDFTLDGYNSKRLRLIIKTMQTLLIKYEKIIEDKYYIEEKETSK